MAIKKYAPENIYKKIGFFGFLVVKEPCTGQSTIEIWVLPTKWGVHHLSTTNGYHDIEFWHFWRPRATPMHNTPGQTVDFFRNNPKMGFNLISYVPLPKKVVQIFIWPYHWITEHLGYTLLGCMLEYHSLQINVCITFLGKGTYEIRLKTIFGLFLKKYTVCPGVLCMGVECGRQKCQNSISL